MLERFKLVKKKKNFDKFFSQLDLPFQATDNKFLVDIFNTLELKFGLKHNSNQRFVDLGAGNGSVVIYVALNYSIKSFGIEIDQSLIEEANAYINSLKKKGRHQNKLFDKIKLKLGDFYLHNLKKYDFVYIYSLPSMQKYLNHVFTTAQKGAIIIAHKFPFISFNSYLKHEFTFKHKDDNQNVFTYFYKKFQ